MSARGEEIPSLVEDLEHPPCAPPGPAASFASPRSPLAMTAPKESPAAGATGTDRLTDGAGSRKAAGAAESSCFPRCSRQWHQSLPLGAQGGPSA